jgi:hypothetical protein
VDQPVPLVPDRHVRAFDAAIDPETRLALYRDRATVARRRRRHHHPHHPGHLGRDHEEIRMNRLEPDHEDLHTRAERILQAMGDTPIPAMDATFYAHYAEELRMLVEELIARRHPSPGARPP